ncbi:glycoside hydrolase family 88 protein [Paenibacillus mucilaginosus]|uniref:Glycosyl hydrolase family 88 n=2 Tax=Paenibacillus mucilaginosus TaxID=61624 RepID=H6NA92_9BACL|nr:glycoside hydrolase family 88 protein [Paenibacillus mucilaginosus]AEI40730.1 glycosyl hydrolase family 88 [Paenibacillus mucilaginosus KNP414]AFC29338.1 glycosyl hydrolase family 88 [Paenibacillus mucilaginosus 3016]MCG7211788.1 glycoside hydrolase family 88 protein [Paenibacillus mucilaginosus]WDM29860.1 glycoside hydrolase family 88 protein [Paenibacillus mucilaginosus]WFA18055.1 glycosyl hydrolase [Paenibacillus mucilaginosus]
MNGTKSQPDWVREAWSRTTAKVTRISGRIGDRFPHASVQGEYKLEPPYWWTAGFWPGLLWLVYRETKNEALRELAESCERQLDQVITDYYKLDHDIGFMWTLTSVARHKLLGAEDSKRRALLAANLLAARFNVQGGYIRAWNPWREGEQNAGWAIIDCMMNLPLLHWASAVTGDPRYKHTAVRHADMAVEHFIRPDGSVNHIVIFDPETGEKVEVNGGQGYGPDSAWSRGTAWAIYGMSLSYHYTQDEKYLHAAKRAAHFFLANLPEDSVPHWDFRLPEGVPAYRDSSAGACAACGLLLLAEQVDGRESALYRSAGERILHSLYVNYGAWDNEEEEGLILHGTSHFPEGKNIDVPLIYGDYYFAEGLARLAGYRELFW